MPRHGNGREGATVLASCRKTVTLRNAKGQSQCPSHQTLARCGHCAKCQDVNCIGLFSPNNLMRMLQSLSAFSDQEKQHSRS